MALCLLLALSTLGRGTAADAASLRYYSGQDAPILTLTLPLTTVGSLVLPNGQLELTENEVHIEAIPEGLFDSRVIITGVIVSATPIDEQSSSMSALVYFYAGNWLNSLHYRPVSELIRTTDGKVYSGQIVDGDNKSLSIRRPDKSIVTIDFKQIANIDSPRAFRMEIPVRNVHAASGYMVGQANSAVFEPTVASRTTTMAANPMMHPFLLGNERGLKNSSFAAYLSADVAVFLAGVIGASVVFNNQYLSQKNLLNQSNNAAALQAAEVQSLVKRFGP